jgi:hypothetical protein
MTVKEAFTADEWRTVGAAPFLVGLYMVAAAPSGPIHVVTEMLTAEKALTLEASRPDALPIVREIEADLLAGVLIRDLGLIDAGADSQARVLEELARAVALVAQKAPAMDSAFRAWLYREAQRLARVATDTAAPGPARVLSDGETAALAALAATLGVPR